MADENSLSCALLAQQAISDDQSQSTCTFCYFDNSPDAPEKCKAAQEWARLQLGTLQCDRYEFFFVVAETVASYTKSCSVILSIRRFTNGACLCLDIAMLQVDIEGFELQMFEAMVQSQQQQPQYALPPVIHFETKVLMVRDVQEKTDTFDRLFPSSTTPVTCSLTMEKIHWGCCCRMIVLPNNSIIVEIRHESTYLHTKFQRLVSVFIDWLYYSNTSRKLSFIHQLGLAGSIQRYH